MKEIELTIREMVNIGKHSLLQGSNLTREVGMVNTKGDKTLEADRVVEDSLVGYCEQEHLPVLIWSEERGFIHISRNPKFLVAMDTLDGSHNYKQGNGMMPFGTFITFYEGTEPKMQDIVASAAIEYTRDLSFYYLGGYTIDSNGNRIHLQTDWQIDPKTPIFLETYKDGYEYWRKVAKELFVKNEGALVGSLTYVLSNIAPAMGGVNIRCEEIGPIYSLIKGAGGLIRDLTGEDISSRHFSPNTTYKIIGGDHKITNFAADLLTEKR